MYYTVENTTQHLISTESKEWGSSQTWKRVFENHSIRVIKVMRFLEWSGFSNKVIRVIKVIANMWFLTRWNGIQNETKLKKVSIEM